MIALRDILTTIMIIIKGLKEKNIKKEFHFQKFIFIQTYIKVEFVIVFLLLIDNY